MPLYTIRFSSHESRVIDIEADSAEDARAIFANTPERDIFGESMLDPSYTDARRYGIEVVEEIE